MAHDGTGNTGKPRLRTILQLDSIVRSGKAYLTLAQADLWGLSWGEVDVIAESW